MKEDHRIIGITILLLLFRVNFQPKIMVVSPVYSKNFHLFQKALYR